MLHTALLEKLLKRTEERRTSHRAHMEKGLPYEDYRETVGKAKSCTEIINEIQRALDEGEAYLNDSETPDNARPGGASKRAG